MSECNLALTNMINEVEELTKEESIQTRNQEPSALSEILWYDRSEYHEGK